MCITHLGKNHGVFEKGQLQTSDQRQYKDHETPSLQLVSEANC